MQLSIRTKIALLMTFLLAIVSVGVYRYFPARLHEQIVDSVQQKSAALTRMAAFSVAEGLHDRSPDAVAAAVSGLRSNPDLAYLILLDESGREFFSSNDLMARQVSYQRVPMESVGARQQVPKGGESVSTPAPEVSGGVTADGRIYQSMARVQHRGRTVGRLYTGMSLEAANADAARSRTAIALVTLLAFIVGTIAVFALSTVITGPLQRIVETTEEIARGDLSKRAAVTSNDEVGHLARSFNGMVDQVAQAYAQLEDLNHTLEERVEDRTRELADSEERYRLLFERNLAGVYMATEDGRLVDCNDACARLFGYSSREELLGAGSIDYMHPHERDSIIRRLREHGAVTNEEVELRGRDGAAVWALENVRRVIPEDGGPPMLEGILLDIGDRKRAEQEIEFKAYHDGLTHLPNRALFLDRLSVALAQARRTNGCMAVLFFDLDNMKAINDTFGHATGDRVLQAVGQRLTGSVRAGDTVARVGGDEFMILLAVSAAAEAEEVAREILGRISQPLLIDNDELYLTTSIGVALYPADGDDADSLMRNADAAMYRVKEAGGHEVQLSSTRAGRHSVGRLSLEEQLRGALERDEFVVHYQPQVHIDSRKLSGAEALVRWQRPDGTLVGPAGFVTVCEQSGLITALGEVVLTKTCKQIVEWQKVGSAPLRVSVNVSARQFYQRDFIGMVQRVLSATGVSPIRLELEITETVAMQTSQRALDMLHELRAMGIAVAIDDFGTGQSSLSYLKRFPVDTVKIDRSFVADLLTGINDEWIITAVLMLANHLGLRTIAEGVETEQQCDFLAGHDCREIQGYLISKPVDAETFAERFLTKRESERMPRAALI
ncbi:MAG TPA: EAL domain-containing protein [Thermoanaerobaculia bacterium]|nr:EAL domain-containing protein [Thermoanaerobaculia bacterium]